ncbi:BLUF domain-containing protein [Acinetobacter sp. HR7]|uniref:BLUF domain-containing protein n=1 Tax=Acinetobacter sp. HR7 TaxID=1509403 RepID=UPI0005392C83|nr:BLUF domain-containing protein [Acinetobacter sp. HR7]KGT47153.1 hypothetical protein GW12_18110 [Acinetobacter sp. HR7]
MLQLCYVSERIETEQDLLQDLSDILATARKFNHEHQIYGVLYYAQGKFFQCLQGEPEIVEQLFQSISKDRRHHQVYRFADTTVEKPRFAEWSMKYVHKHSEIAAYFSSLGHSTFLPHELNQDDLNGLLDLLYQVDENHQQLVSPQGYKQRGYVPYF